MDSCRYCFKKKYICAIYTAMIDALKCVFTVNKVYQRTLSEDQQFYKTVKLQLLKINNSDKKH